MEKRSVGRPKLANEKLKKSSIAFIITGVLLTLVMTFGGILSLGVSVKNLTGNVSNFKYYSQNDSRWARKNFCGRTVNKNTMSGAACGVTSMAMILATLKNDSSITPVTTMKEAQKAGYCGNYISGTDYKYFKYSAEKHGLKYQNVGKNADGVAKIKEALRGNNSLVLVNVGPNSPFTSGGHYIVIYKIAKNGRVYVADPNPKKGNKSTDTYDLQTQFVNKGWVTNGWAIISRKTSNVKYTAKNINTYSTLTTNAQPNNCSIRVLALNSTAIKYQIQCQPNAKPVSVRLVQGNNTQLVKNKFGDSYGLIGTYIYKTNSKFNSTDKLVLNYSKNYIGNNKADGEAAKDVVNLYNNGKANTSTMVARTSNKLLPKDKCSLMVYNVSSNDFSWKFSCDKGASPQSLRLTTKEDNEFVGKQLGIISTGYNGAYGVSDSKVAKNKVQSNKKYTLVLYFRTNERSWYRTYVSFMTP